MFTSRAEYRLTLRADNADQRLTPVAVRAGVVGAERARAFGEKAEALETARRIVAERALTPNEARAHGFRVNLDGRRRSAQELLAFPDIALKDLARVWPELGAFSPAVAEQLAIDAQYAGYLDRQEADILAFRKDEGLRLDPDLDYAAVPGLSNEVRAKLAAARPATLGQAARVEGATPAALTLLLAHIRGGRSTRDSA